MNEDVLLALAILCAGTAMGCVVYTVVIGRRLKVAVRHYVNDSQWEHRYKAAVQEIAGAERVLAAALGYPKYGDPRPDGTVDPDPPGDPDDFAIGEHTVVTLAAEAARRIRRSQ